MRVSMCVGKYAQTPYCIEGLETRVYCMEELCYCLRENAFLLDLSLLDAGLVDWIDEECGEKELAGELMPMVRRQGSLSAFVTLIQEYVGFYDSDTIREIGEVLKSGSGLSGLEKRKNQVDYLVRKGKYPAAVRRYDALLSQWEEETAKGDSLPGSGIRALILHNKGVALAGMMEYEAAAECFQEACDMDGGAEHYRAYLAAKRSQLGEQDYLAFVAERPESYEESLELEKELEQLEESFRESEGGVRLERLREWRSGGDRQSYYDELERITRRMKESYRNSVSE